jgi:ribonuclease T2
MNKLLFVLIFFTVSLVARYEAFATKECPAFNNIKHTENTHHVILDTTRKYTVLKHHKGQTLILIKGEQPAQRWVDDRCFQKQNETTNPLNVEKVQSRVIGIEDETYEASVPVQKDKKLLDSTAVRDVTASKQNLLVLSWHNAFCETHRTKKECKRGLLSMFKPNYHESHFVLHGLWPQPKNRVYCNVDRKIITMDRYKYWNKLPSLGLTAKTKEALSKVMPGVRSDLHKHEWFKHGTCYGTDAEQYYKDAITLVEQLNESAVGDFFAKHIGKKVSLKQIQKHFDKSFGTGTGKRVELKCKDGLITELWLHLGSGDNVSLNTLLRRGKQTRSHCQRGLIDRAGFGR